MNPCRCGHLDDPSLACARAPRCAQDYQARISGPLFDRIDLHVDVPAVSPADLSLPPPAEDSAQVAARVAAARAAQRDRFAALGAEPEAPEPAAASAGAAAAPAGDDAGTRARPVGPRTNAEADGDLLERIAAPDEAGRALLTDAATKLKLTARGYHRVLRVARTLADLDGATAVRRPHIAEALGYRRLALGR